MIHISLRDGSHVRTDRTVTAHTTPSGGFDVRTTVARHVDGEGTARSSVIGSKSLEVIRPWNVLHQPSLVPADRSRAFGPTNVASKPVRPAIAYSQSPCSNVLELDPGAHLPPRSLAARPVDTPAPSPWLEPTPPPDRLSFAVRADRLTRRSIRRSKSTAAERTVGGMPWSLKMRTTAAYGLESLVGDLARFGGGGATKKEAEAKFRSGQVNMLGARSAAPDPSDRAGIDTGRASRLACSLWHATSETYQSGETKRVEEGLVLKDGPRHELRRRFDRLSSIRRTEIDAVVRLPVERAAQAAVQVGVAAPNALAVTTSYVLRLIYSTDPRLAQLRFDRRRETASLDSKDVDGLLQAMGLVGIHGEATFLSPLSPEFPLDQLTPARQMPTATSAAHGSRLPWVVVLGGAPSGSSALAMKTVRAFEAACKARRLPVVIVVGTEYNTSQMCPRADNCPSRTDDATRAKKIVHPRRECDGSICHRLSQCLACGHVGDRDVFAASNIIFAKISEWLHGCSEFDRPVRDGAGRAALKPQTTTSSSLSSA